MPRRTFLGVALGAVPFGVAQLGMVNAVSGDTAVQPQASPVLVRRGDDREGVHKTLGISAIDFKVTSADSGGAMLVIENTNRAKGGPARHLHIAQDEHFYCLEGEYRIEVGGSRYELRAGDSLLAPRQVPHVWAYVGNSVGRLLITFTPPGLMEPFFREVSKGNTMPIQDPALWRAHGMELLGPPLPV